MVNIQVEFAGLESFEGYAVIAIELDFHAVDVVFAAVDRQVCAPIVLYALVHHAASRIDPGDAVWPAVESGLEGGLSKLSIFPVMLRQYG